MPSDDSIVISKSYHSIIFIDEGDYSINTWTDWHLIPSSRPTIVQPTPAYKYVEIPGRSGSLDISDYLTGSLTYSDRKGTLEFIAVNNDGAFSYPNGASHDDWITRKNEIASFLNGKKLRVILEDSPDYYYYGRVFFKEWRPDANFSRVVFEYQLNPFKYNVQTNKEAGL